VAIFDDRLEVELSPRAAMRPTVSEPPERALLPSGRLDAPFSQLYPDLKVALSRIRGGAAVDISSPGVIVHCPLVLVSPFDIIRIIAS
jgi:hypothetical protein